MAVKTNGVWYPIGDMPYNIINMVQKTNEQVIVCATTSSLASDEQSFTVTWKNEGFGPPY